MRTTDGRFHLNLLFAYFNILIWLQNFATLGLITLDGQFRFKENLYAAITFKLFMLNLIIPAENQFIGK